MKKGGARKYGSVGRIVQILCVCMAFLVHDCSGIAETVQSVRHGDRTSLKIAITIDDCYDARYIQAALELCKDYNIKMTFFPIGNALKYADADLWKSVVEAGCEIGNHSWGHKDLTRLNSHSIKFQMLRTQQKIDALLGYHYPMQVMRPPYGRTNSKVAKAVSLIGYQIIARWDVSETDARKAAKDVQNGSILL